MTLAIPGGRDRVVDIIPVGRSIVAEVALVGTMVDATLFRTLRDIILDRQMVDPDFAADTELARMVDHYVLDNLHATGMCRVDQIPVGVARRLQARINPGPVV